MKSLVKAVAFGIFVTVGSGQAADVSVRIDFDWSATQHKRELAERLVQAGQMPSPIIFVDGQPAELMPGGVKLPNDKKSRIDIGLIQFVEGPLYSFEIDSRQPLGKIVSVTHPLLTVSREANSKFGTPVVLEGKEEQKVALSRLEDGTYKVALPSLPYTTLVEVAKEYGITWDTNVRVVHRDAKGGFLRAPWENERFGSAVLREDLRPALMRSYPAINVDWLKNGLQIYVFSFGYPSHSELFLQTKPPGAAIIINGVNQDKETNDKVTVDRNLWKYIGLVLRPEYETCWVEAEKVQPGPTPDAPKWFYCKLERVSRH